MAVAFTPREWTVSHRRNLVDVFLAIFDERYRVALEDPA